MQTDQVHGWLYGTDPTPGILSVWADWQGRALVWRRVAGQVVLSQERFQPWVYARHLQDLQASRVPFAPAVGARPEHEITYQVLPGPSDSFRCLMQARDGRVLRKALLEGASKRLGRKVTSLHQVHDLHVPGPTEQYLMQSGRTCFKGMVYTDLHRMQIDLETTSLSAAEGRIFLVAVRDNRGLETVLDHPDERQLIQSLTDLIQERDPDVIENHNLMGFDLPFLWHRAGVLGLGLPWGRKGGPQGLTRRELPDGTQRFSAAGRDLIDTLDAVRRHQFVARDLPSARLKDVARHFGLARPDRVYLSGAEVYSTHLTHPEKVREYALDDVREVSLLSERLLQPAFALTQMAPRTFERVACAGTATGILEPMLVRAYLQAGQALPCAAPEDFTHPHEGGAVHLFQTGVARGVVKADVASLYPSIMRMHRIGPRCDTLGVLVALVDQLTTRRLHHKKLAQQGGEGAQMHHALQAAMKLVINSAYGYLGAGKMALFADRAAADRITELGREVLQQVLQQLQQRGMTLIEADTDGVFFALPAGWGKPEAREVVQQVNLTLPREIQLEFEGWYPAMYSHQVKNYALLTETGELVVRGASLHSVRAPRYAVRFLQTALHRLLRADVTGVHQAYMDTVAALRAGQLSTADVAVRVRLSRSSEAYLQVRHQRKEAACEAMLLAGNSSWRAGTRISLYQAQDGTPRLLPEGEDRADHDIHHAIAVLRKHHAERLCHAFDRADFEAVFPLDRQGTLFERPVDQVQIRQIVAGQGTLDPTQMQ